MDILNIKDYKLIKDLVSQKNKSNQNTYHDLEKRISILISYLEDKEEEPVQILTVHKLPLSKNINI